MHGVVFADVSKTYGDGSMALDHLDLRVEPAEFFAMVGPSGCGKSTALRIVAGLEQPTSGRVLIGGRDVTGIPTRQRDLGLVTQTSQLMNHRTAAGNIRFPLQVRDRRHRRERADSRVLAEAANLGIQRLLDRSPKDMSEGERRAVQLARALVARPSTLLLDEPLEFLDDQIRLRLRSDIGRIHRERGTTTLLVTANQHDAMAMADRIVALFDGAVHQIGTPSDVYLRPATVEVAAFFGEPAMNVMRAAVRVIGGERRVELLGRSFLMHTPVLDAYADRSVLVGFRPHDLVPGGASGELIGAHISATESTGRETLAEIVVQNGSTATCTIPGPAPRVGSFVELDLRADRLHLFDPGTGMAIFHPIE